VFEGPFREERPQHKASGGVFHALLNPPVQDPG
jgi:hypothetical protein